MIPNALQVFSISQRPTVSGSLPDGTVVSSNSARYHRAHSGDTSGWHLLSGRLPGTVRHDTGNAMNAVFAHLPVMLEQITDVFSDMNDGVFLDATLGGAGHSTAILTAHPNVSLLGIDQDDMALESAEQVLAAAGCSGRVALRRARFDAAALIAAKEGISALSGALFDLGVSSPQFDVAERGFSYRFDAPLDMRMDQSTGISAVEVVNNYSHEELTRIIREYGEEKFASRIAARIIDARKVAPVTSTIALAQIVKESIPAATRRTGGNPAKRTFQALRIYVNNEIDVLERAIPAALELLAVSGRMVVLSYHSLEDRIVKRAFAEVSTSEVPHGLPVEPAPTRYQLLTRSSESASPVEIESNPRAQSVRIRAIERRAA